MEAAIECFSTDGYAATTMRSIANAASVSVPTVEVSFRTKPLLLKAAIDVAIAGDDSAVPMLQRDWAADAEDSLHMQTFLKRFARALRDAHIRSAALITVVSEAARTDPAMADLNERLARQRAVTVAWVVDRLRTRASLRPDLSRRSAIDTVWLLMDPSTFVRLTTDRRWTPARYERWFVDSVVRLLLSEPSSSAPPRSRRGVGSSSANCT